MKLTIQGIQDQQPIPEKFAFGIPGDGEPMAIGPNRNPALAWEDAPENTKSYAIILVDPDVPENASDANQPGKMLAADLTRDNFYHWVLVDIPVNTSAIEEGAASDGVTPHGKDIGRSELGLRGINSFTDMFADDPDMEGTYGGYDGPCPPWNDERIHHYHFTVYALDVETLGLSNGFSGAEAEAAIQDHVLGKASVVGTYTLNPALR